MFKFFCCLGTDLRQFSPPVSGWEFRCGSLDRGGAPFRHDREAGSRVKRTRAGVADRWSIGYISMGYGTEAQKGKENQNDLNTLNHFLFYIVFQYFYFYHIFIFRVTFSYFYFYSFNFFFLSEKYVFNHSEEFSERTKNYIVCEKGLRSV